MTDGTIDISAEVKALCDKFDADYHMVSKITLTPGDAIVDAWVPDAEGKLRIGEDGDVPSERRSFKVRT